MGRSPIQFCLRASSIFIWAAGLVLLSSAIPQASAQIANARQSSDLDALALNTDAVAPRRFLAVHGRRALMDGYADSGLEVWAYPVELIQGYRIGFLPNGTTSEVPGAAILRRITYLPQAVIRTYIGPNFIVREKIFVPVHTAAAIVTYTVESHMPVDIIVHFVPVLNLMWPAGIGGQDVNWNASSLGYVMSEPTNRFSAVIGSTDIVDHDEIFNRAKSSAEPGSVAFTVRPVGSSTERTATVVVASGEGDAKRLPTLVKTLTDTSEAAEQRASSHYRDLRAAALEIETPDSSLNSDLAWAQIALDQAWVCNPYLGCGLVAGYGPSRGARRPQYAWFFAGDAMIAVRALLSEGQYSRARKALEFVAKYQDPHTGMIWHEMSQSAGLIDWTGKYPYMFVHVDISFQYLNTVAAYVAASGDKKFLRENWSSVQAAYRYCESLIDPADGLPRIPAGKEGGDEQDRMSDELTLSASWVQASESFAKMAAWIGDASQAASAMAASEKARRSFPNRYWSQQANFWIDGYSPSGSKIVNRSVNGNSAILEHLFNQSEEHNLLDQLASPNFQTDWGTRSTALNSGAFDPDSYAKGSVWAVGTANVAMAFWMNHRPATALPIWNSLAPWSSLDSLGHMDEVLAGDYYHEQTESVPEQTWSSAAFLRSTVEGLLGLRVDAVDRKITFSPHLPADWNKVVVRRIQMEDSKIDLTWVRTESGSELETVNEGEPVDFEYTAEIPLGAHLTGANWNGKAISAKLDEHQEAGQATVHLKIPPGTAHLQLGYRGGIELLLPRPKPMLGSASHGMKVVGVHLHGNVYVVNAECETGHLSTFEVLTQRKIVAVHGATWKAGEKNISKLTIVPPNPSGDRSKYVPVEIQIDLTPQN